MQTMMTPNNHTAATILHPLGDPLPGGGGKGRLTSGHSHRSTGSLTSSSFSGGRKGTRRGNANFNNQCTLSIANNNHNQPQQSAQTSSSSGSSSSAPSPNTKRQQTKKLPRSVRWRLSLNLLTRPVTSTEEKDQLLKSIEDLNALKLRFQRSRYEELEKKHYWKSTPMGIANHQTSGGSSFSDFDSTPNGSGHNGNEEHNASMNSLHQVAPGEDPLSAFAMNDSKHGGNKFGGGLFGGGPPKGHTNRARTRSKGDLAGSFTSNGSNSEDGDEAMCKGSRWADFYSTREVLDVIEKDLIRLPSDHYKIFHDWRIKERDWKDHREKEEKWRREQEERELKLNSASLDTILADDNDPRALASSQSSIYSAKSYSSAKPLSREPMGGLGKSLNLGAIGKSFMRERKKSFDNLATLLQDDEPEMDEGLKRQENAQAEIQTSIKERASRISRMLFVYAREHHEIGYRQGMHEILSHILLALEMDLLEDAIGNERQRWRRNSLTFGEPTGKGRSFSNGGMAGVDASGNIVKIRLLDPNCILADAYNLFECIMFSLAPAYDAALSEDESAVLAEAEAEEGQSPMELMTSSIVSKIRYVARDEKLFALVLYMPVPPQLYFAKWIRLMFGREVAGGIKSIMTLWGAFFDLASARESTHEDLSITTALLDVLKTAAASMILLIRRQLLAPTRAPDGTMTGDPDPNNGIGYLMNYPPIKDIGGLVETISQLLKIENNMADQYQISKERRLSKQFLPLENYKISSIREDPLDSSARSNSQPSPPRSSTHKGNANEGKESADKIGGLIQVIRADLPPVHKPIGNLQHRHQQHDVGHEVADALGHFKEGLLDIGSKTVDFGAKTASAAIASVIEARRQSVDQPLQRNDNYTMAYRPTSSRRESLESSNSSRRGSLIIPIPGEPEDESSKESSDSDETSVKDIVLDLENEQSHVDWGEMNDDGDQSLASKVSMSQRSPKEMAGMLEKSVATLMKHFNEQLVARSVTSAGEGSTRGVDPLNTSEHSTGMLPGAIWDAMADIDIVRKELQTHSALTAIEQHSRSCASLRASNTSGSGGKSLNGSITKRRGRRRSEEDRVSWQL